MPEGCGRPAESGWPVAMGCIKSRSGKTPQTLESKYDIETSLLGEGTFAKVFLGVNRKTKVTVAVKLIDKLKSRSELLDTEIYVMKKFGNHPNIVALYDIYETDDTVQLVMEFMAGGELFDVLDENGPYGEANAVKHMRSVGSALGYLHAGGVAHRDLKPENLLLTSKGLEGVLKLSDFGLAKILEGSQLMSVACGTWIYCAPEVLRVRREKTGSYSMKCDMFSIGLILFVVLAGYHPFDIDGTDDEEKMQQCIVDGGWSFDDPAWAEVSEKAKDLIKQLLENDPDKRFSAVDMMAHPWITGHVRYGRLSVTINQDLRLMRNSLKTKRAVGDVTDDSTGAPPAVRVSRRGPQQGACGTRPCCKIDPSNIDTADGPGAALRLAATPLANDTDVEDDEESDPELPGGGAAGTGETMMRGSPLAAKVPDGSGSSHILSDQEAPKAINQTQGACLKTPKVTQVEVDVETAASSGGSECHSHDELRQVSARPQRQTFSPKGKLAAKSKAVGSPAKKVARPNKCVHAPEERTIATSTVIEVVRTESEVSRTKSRGRTKSLKKCAPKAKCAAKTVVRRQSVRGNKRKSKPQLPSTSGDTESAHQTAACCEP